MREKLWSSLAVLALAVPLWMLLGPADLGGPATYVSTYGISMKPGFTAGDLAILKPAATYSMADLAGYEADTLNITLVLHRIVETAGDQFVFKGDNNTWLDPDQPTEEEVVGTVIDVPDIDTLATLAKRYALLILRGVQDSRDVYLIQDESTTYRYLGERHPAQVVPGPGAPALARPLRGRTPADPAGRSRGDRG